METVGEYLKSEREKIGLTQDDVSKLTKIRLQYINALESNDFSLFSSNYTLKSYIKSVALAIKADKKHALELYDLDSVAKNKINSHHEDIVRQKVTEEQQKVRNMKIKIFIGVLSFLLFVIFIYIGIKLYDKIINNNSNSAVHKLHKLKSKKVSKTKYKVILKGDVIRKTWVDLSIDNKKPYSSMLYPGIVKVWKAKKYLWIKIGNAGGIYLTYNGKYLGKLGKEKEVIALHFPKNS